MVFLIDALFILFTLTIGSILCFCQPAKKQNKCPVRELTPSMRQGPISDVQVDSTRTAMDKSEKRKRQSAEEKGSRKSKKKKKADSSMKVSKKSKKGVKGAKSQMKEPETTQPSVDEGAPQVQVAPQTAKTAPSVPSVPTQPSHPPANPANPASAVPKSPDELPAGATPPGGETLVSVTPNNASPSAPSPGPGPDQKDAALISAIVGGVPAGGPPKSSPAF